MAPDQLELPPSDGSRPEALAFVLINVEDDLSPKALMISIDVRNITSITEVTLVHLRWKATC